MRSSMYCINAAYPKGGETRESYLILSDTGKQIPENYISRMRNRSKKGYVVL
jgi:hypothetical protein